MDHGMQCTNLMITFLSAHLTISRYLINFIYVYHVFYESMLEYKNQVTSFLFSLAQFVNFTKIMSENETSKKETAFALAALMEIPFQYRATQALHVK